MSVEDFQVFEEQCQHPRERHNAPRDGRSERDAMKFITTIGEQPFDLRRANAARLRVDRVEPEVVPEDHAARLSRGGVRISEYT